MVVKGNELQCQAWLDCKLSNKFDKGYLGVYNSKFIFKTYYWLDGTSWTCKSFCLAFQTFRLANNSLTRLKEFKAAYKHSVRLLPAF